MLTTSIVLETGKGEFDKAIALGLILLALSFTINLIVNYWASPTRGLSSGALEA